MRKKLLFYFVFLNVAYSQNLPQTYNFDSTITNTFDSMIVYVRNPLNVILSISNTKTQTRYFQSSLNSFSINANDSLGVKVYFKTHQNMTFTDYISFESQQLNYTIIQKLTATGVYPDTIYKFTQGLRDEALKNVLKPFTTLSYIQLGYNAARDRMFETVDDYGGDTIECVYTGRKIRATNRTEAQSQNFNTEHTWPQSFFNELEPMRSDLYHLYPTDETANNVRSNFDFGRAISGVTWNVGGSKLGYDSTNQQVFEPRDIQKGNIARAIFYFATKYGNNGGFLDAKQENILKVWNGTDTVDARERLRNERVRSFQNVRNPFIDHPEFAERIFTFWQTTPSNPRPEISASPNSFNFDTTRNGDSSFFYVSVFNTGIGNLTIIASTSNNVFELDEVTHIIPENEYKRIRVKFKPIAQITTYTGQLRLVNSDSLITVNMTGVSSNNVGIISLNSEIPSQYRLWQNYPNPFNSQTRIKFDIAKKDGETKIKIYNITGKEILGYQYTNLSSGRYEMNLNFNDFPSGVYFIKFQSGEYREIRKINLIK
ncbi:MAG TPA: endonuclease [Ignavibacteria bacterium]|nr:endonuclease [Ignavibacteria bacterium]